MHCLSAEDIGPQLGKLFDLTDNMKALIDHGTPGTCLKDKIIGTLFVDNEPSTRTKISFQTAITRLGGTFIDVPNCSINKGESIEDTIRTLSYYFDGLIVRLNESFPANLVCPIPIINAGSGCSEHPTQALLDVYTMYKKLKPDSYSIAITGDLAKSRVVRSLLMMIEYFNKFKKAAKVYFYGTMIPEDLKELGQTIYDHEFLKVLPEIDVLYMTRMQTERGSHFTPTFMLFSKEMDALKKDALIMHPLPRGGELQTWVDRDQRAVYFREQVPNGLITRMALLNSLICNKGNLSEDDHI